MSADNTPREWTPEQIEASALVYCPVCHAPPHRSCQSINWDGDFEPYLTDRDPHPDRIRWAIKQAKRRRQ